MNEITVCFVLLLSVAGTCVATTLYWLNKITSWRIRWIELEHDLARAQGREPRDIDNADKSPNT